MEKETDRSIELEVWGDLACFTRPECKVERLTYPLPNPSAARGILNAIYSKPPEFYWQVTQIEVLNKIRHVSFKRNEVKDKIPRSLDVLIADGTSEDNKGRTQRQTVMLKDVRYRIRAQIVKREEARVREEDLYEQAWRRIRKGKCFYQPSLGLRECAAYFAESDGTRAPIPESMDLGIMLYDVFDLRKTEPLPKAQPYITLFHAALENGILRVPEFLSSEVLHPGGAVC